MANPTITVDQQRLILNSFMSHFQNKLVSANIFTWRKHDKEYNDRNKLTVTEQIGPRYNVHTTVGAVKDLTSGVQDSVFGSETFSLNRTFGTDLGWEDFVRIRDMNDAKESEALSGAANNLAEGIDSYLMRFASTISNNWVGNPENGVSKYGDVASAYTRLKEEGAPDLSLSAILAYIDRQNLAETVQQYPATDNLATTAFRKGFDGMIDGIPTSLTQQLAVFNPGNRAATGGSVDGAAQNVNYREVAESGVPGQYLTQEITLDGITADLKKGDVFTIAGVNAWDNRMGQELERLQQFVVVEDATATAGAATVRIFPAIIVPGTGTGNDVGVNTAHATVNSVPADDAAVEFLCPANTIVKPRLVINKDAMIVNTADLIMPATGHAMRKSLSRVPLSVRMWRHSDFNTGLHSVRFDVALEANVYDRRKIVRINGQD